MTINPTNAREAQIARTLPPGTRVEHLRTHELATVVARDPRCAAACTTVEYDGDEGNTWNTPTHKLEIIGSVEDMGP